MENASSKMPALFVGHGSPMNAIEKNEFSLAQKNLSKLFPKPKAILAISAHWETEGTQITASENPKMIYDFYGFPKELSEVKYPAKGSADLVHKIKTLLPDVQPTSNWGLDHGTWSVLVHMYPQADIPVVQMSLDRGLTPQQHFELGRKLQPLRDEGVLILGTGNVVHNLRYVVWRGGGQVLDWAERFDKQVKENILNRDIPMLVDYERSISSGAKLAVPSPEHYLPLLYILGASTAEDQVSFPIEGFQMASISMRTVLFQSFKAL